MGMNRNLRSLVEGKKKDWTVKDWEDKQDDFIESLDDANNAASSSLNRAKGMLKYGFSAKENYDEIHRLSASVARAIAMLKRAQGILEKMEDEQLGS